MRGHCATAGLPAPRKRAIINGRERCVGSLGGDSRSGRRSKQGPRRPCLPCRDRWSRRRCHGFGSFAFFLAPWMSRTASSQVSGKRSFGSSARATSVLLTNGARSVARSTHQLPRSQRKVLTHLSSRSCGAGQECHSCAAVAGAWPNGNLADTSFWLTGQVPEQTPLRPRQDPSARRFGERTGYIEHQSPPSKRSTRTFQSRAPMKNPGQVLRHVPRNPP